MSFVVSLALLALSAPASAGTCDAIVARGTTATGDAAVAAFRDAVACDPRQAESSFDAFWAQKDDETVTAVAVAAIDAKLYTPVGKMMEKIPAPDQRDLLATKVGEGCTAHPEVLTFVQWAYFGLLDREFSQWDNALSTCNSDTMSKWLETLVLKPPKSSYDEKYSAIVTAYVRHQHVDALPVLERASIEAANSGGPFGMLIERMGSTIESDEMGATVKPEDKKRLDGSMVKVANQVGAEQAALVADRLYSGGSPEAAASLLPRIYPNRVQDDGTLLYGVASIETCDKDVVIHWAPVYDPAKRWSILDDVVAPARTFKPKLKCGVTTDKPWEVLSTGEPVALTSDIKPWLDEVVAKLTAKGLGVSTKEEKAINLP